MFDQILVNYNLELLRVTIKQLEEQVVECERILSDDSVPAEMKAHIMEQYTRQLSELNQLKEKLELLVQVSVPAIQVQDVPEESGEGENDELPVVIPPYILEEGNGGEG